MAEKALPPKKRVRFKLPPDPSAGTSAGGGGGAAAVPASAPRRTQPPSSPPRSPSPPQPFTYDFDEGSADSKDSDDKEPEEFKTEYGWGSLFMSDPQFLSIYSTDPQNPPHYIGRQNCEALARQKFLSLHRNWPQLLAGKSTYLRPPKNNRVAKDNSDDSVFVTPKPPEWARQCQDSKDSDDKKPDEFKTEYGWGSLFMSDPQVLSSDPQNLPHYIGRQNCEPLSKQEFFSLRHNWQQLLDGKKTYLRPTKNNRVAKDNCDDSVFVTPKPPELALRLQRSLSDLVGAAKGNPTIRQKYKILSEHYVCYRRVRSDGSQFYRAFLFSYLENLGKMQGSEAEVTRLMECVERSRVNFRRLQWNNAYFSNPEAFFSSVVTEFEHLVNSVANGLLTEVHIRTHEADYNRVLDQETALSFCIKYVRPFGAGIDILQIGALSQALGIPVCVAFVDSTMKDGTVQVQCTDVIPQSESGVSRTSVSFASVIEYYLSSATDKHPVLPVGNLFSSDRMPLVTMFLTTADTIVILYRE